MGAPAPPQGGEKFFFRPNLQEKCVSAPPQDTKCTPSQSKSQFLGVFAEKKKKKKKKKKNLFISEW